MPRLKRTATTAAVIVSVTSALMLMTAGSVSAAFFTAHADLVLAGWGTNPALGTGAPYTTLQVFRNFESSSGLGVTIFVELEMHQRHCEATTNDLIDIDQGNGGALVGLPSDLTLTTISAHYSGKLSLVEYRTVRHDCVTPGPPVTTMHPLGTVQVTADWVIGKRARVHLCEHYATPPPPTISLILGWRSEDAQPSTTVAGAVTASFLPAARYVTLAQSTFTLGGIPATPIRPAGCVVA